MQKRLWLSVRPSDSVNNWAFFSEEGKGIVFSLSEKEWLGLGSPEEIFVDIRTAAAEVVVGARYEWPAGYRWSLGGIGFLVTEKITSGVFKDAYRIRHDNYIPEPGEPESDGIAFEDEILEQAVRL